MGIILGINKIAENRQRAKELTNKVIKRGTKEGRPFGDILQEELKEIEEQNEEEELNPIFPLEFDKGGRLKYNPGLHPNQGKQWSKDDLDYLINWYSKIGLEEMSLALGRSEGTVATKVNILRKDGVMVKETPNMVTRYLRPKKKATENPDQSVLSSTRKISISLYHSLEVCQ